jgi:hypothetical protein
LIWPVNGKPAPLRVIHLALLPASGFPSFEPICAGHVTEMVSYLRRYAVPQALAETSRLFGLRSAVLGQGSSNICRQRVVELLAVIAQAIKARAKAMHDSQQAHFLRRRELFLIYEKTSAACPIMPA